MSSNARTYARFYSASDVQLIISNTSDDSMLTLDLATGVGFNESAPSQPIYGLGAITPSFFVRGNSIVTGFLGIAYKYEAYLRKSILYVNGITEKPNTTYLTDDLSTFDALKSAIRERDIEENSDNGSSILDASMPFNLTIVFSTDSIDGAFESLVIQDCRLTGRSLSISSDGENPVSEGFSFVAARIK